MIDPAKKKKILDADVANIVRKVKAGKPLTAREREIIETEEKPPRPPPATDAHAPLKSPSMGAAVADLRAHGLDISLALLKKFKKEGGATAGFEPSNRLNLGLFIPWFKNRVASTPATGDKPTKEELECRKLLAQCIRVEKDNDIADAKYYEAAAVDAWIGNTQATIKSILSKKLKSELPPKLEGLRAPEIAARMETVIADIVKLIRFCHTAPVERDSHAPGSTPAL